MAKLLSKTLLFLDAPDGERARASVTAFQAVAGAMRLPWQAVARTTADIADADWTLVARVVCVNDACKPWVTEHCPERLETIEWWPASAVIADEIGGLIARLLGGGTRPVPPPVALPMPKPAKKITVKLGRETAGRRGKGVSVIWEIPLDEKGLQDLATILKQRCGTGGTVKDERIEIQGDHRDKLKLELEKLGYLVKRVGG